MNTGFFGFPNTPETELISVTEIDTTSYYNIPLNASSLIIFAVGGGGGGGSGRYGSVGANAGGGGGGGGGATIYLHYPLDNIITPGTNLFVNIGAGGNGGAAVTTVGTNGNSGTVGGATFIQAKNQVGFLAYAIGGNLGSGGTTAGGTAGAARGGVYFHHYTALHGGGGSAGAIGVKPSNYTILAPVASGTTWHGGAGGAGYTNTGTLVAAGCDIVAGTSSTVSFHNPIGSYAANAIVCAGGIANGGNGSSSNLHVCGKLSPGVGGAGGGGGTTNGAGSGGKGYRGSGGGGGGGCWSTNGNSGAGGKGGDGYVCILALS
jgi:hypothetical protein